MGTFSPWLDTVRHRVEAHCALDAEQHLQPQPRDSWTLGPGRPRDVGRPLLCPPPVSAGTGASHTQRDQEVQASVALCSCLRIASGSTESLRGLSARVGTYQLRDRGQASYPVPASVPSSVKWA